MKKAKMISAGLMCLMLSAFSVFPSEAAEKVTPGDVNGDGTINIVDYIRLKKHFISGADNGNSDEGSDVNSDGAITSADLTALRNILLNVTDPGSSNEEPVTEYPIDESCILEPKGTIHTGEGTFYGGGYVGGCAMLDPVSTDYWIVAMNLEDYADVSAHLEFRLSLLL